jgi:type II restriction enzyme
VKYHNFYKNKIDCNDADEVFDYLINNLKPTITNWDYFVNWAKAKDNLTEFKIALHAMDYLIGAEDIEKSAKELIKKQPDVAHVIPILLACRENKFQILKDYKSGSFVYDDYNFSKNAKIDADKAVEFMCSSGLLNEIKTKNITSIVDYVFGIEVGLGSNGRKNRGGTAMEKITGFFIDELCSKQGYQYINEATAKKISGKWGKKITVTKSNRAIDFAINTPNRMFLIETNFYGGGGSKLKSTAGEYRSDFKQWSSDGHQFIWITDGAGWGSTRGPLRDTFDQTDYILNLGMIEKGLLKDLIDSEK